jgi:hypothetical protein
MKTIGLSELIKRLQAEYLKGGETVYMMVLY